MSVTPDDVKKGIEFGKKLWDYWTKVQSALGGKKSQILMTGMPGVGKTTLFDFMTGKGYQPGYRPSGTSKVQESGKLSGKDRTVGLVVVPGQAAPPRYQAVEQTIRGKQPPDGIIHVVANGFATIRSDSSTDIIQRSDKSKTLLEHRSQLRADEIKELAEVCSWIREAHRQHRKPMWLLLVVTKYDLFANDTDIPLSYFPGGRGEVVQALDLLTSQVGTDNFRWQACTACSSLELFQWKKTSVRTILSTQQRDTMIEELVKLVLALSTLRRS